MSKGILGFCHFFNNKAWSDKTTLGGKILKRCYKNVVKSWKLTFVEYYVVDVVQDIHTWCIFIKTLFYFIDIPKIYLTLRTNILTTLPQYNSNFHTTTLFSWIYWHVNRINLSPLFVIPRTNYNRLFGGLLSSFSLPYLYVRYFISQIPLQLKAPSKFSSGQWDKPESFPE